MNPQTQPETAWFALEDTAIDYKLDQDHALRFVMLRRGPHQAGAWLLDGRPFMLVPAGQA